MVVDGAAGREYDAIAITNLRFSPSGQHLAYQVIDAENDKSLVVIDGREGKRYDGVFRGSLTFQDENTVQYAARMGNKFYRVTHHLNATPQ